MKVKSFCSVMCLPVLKKKVILTTESLMAAFVFAFDVSLPHRTWQDHSEL